MNFTNVILLAIGVTIFLKVVHIAVVWSRLMKVKHRLHKCSIIDEALIPAMVAPIFRAADRAMLPLGFFYLHSEQTSDAVPYFHRIYYHTQTNSFALVKPSETP